MKKSENTHGTVAGLSGLAWFLVIALISSISMGTAFAADTIKIGYISPITGSHAEFSESDPYMISKIKALLKDGLVIKGKKYKVEILQKDSQSSMDRAANLSAQLIFKNEVDLLLVPDSLSSITAADQAEINEVPLVSTMMPWQAWMFPRKGDPAVGFDWTFHFFWGLEDVMKCYTDMWTSVETNKIVGGLYANNPSGQAFANREFGLPAAIASVGYKEVDGGLFIEGAQDYSPFIAKFKTGDTDIITGLSYVQDWATFWSQAAQQGLKPKVVTMAACLLFPSGLEVLGNRGDGLTTEIWWHPNVPYKSSLTGETAAQLAASYEKETGRQWTQPLGYAHAIWEIGIEALKRAGDPHDRDAVRDALAKMKMDTIVGAINWADTPIKNVSKTTLVGGQWRLGGKYKYELMIVNNNAAPQVPVQADLKLLTDLK
jgi:branched-chain amino acid transport system substrate-binding protein